MSRYIFLWYQHLLHNQNLLLTSFYSQTCKKFLMVNTVVIPAAGLGTRLFTVTKESPKEMVPVFYKTKNGTVLLKPLLEIIFENLYDSGFRNFCLIVGRGKETIENHLSPHYDFIEFLKKKGESQYAKILSNLYKKIEESSIVWVRQHVQKGIGPATLLAKDFVADRPFLFHAGDLYIPKTKYLDDIIKTHKKIKPTATIGLKRVKDPRRYGVATLKKSSGYLKIVKVVEKTKNNVVGSLMSKSEPCIDIGVPETYFDALKYSFRHIVKK